MTQAPSPLETADDLTTAGMIAGGAWRWVEAQAKAGRYSNASDYVRDLIRRDQERADKMAALQSLITEGIESGISTLSVDDLLTTARERAAVIARGHGV